MKSLTKVSDHINWFPGHMRKALRNLQQNAKNIDVFLEIRDARIPYTSRNNEFDMIIKLNQKKKHIIFNKFDLCDKEKTSKVIKDYEDYGIKCFAVSTREHEDMRKVIGVIRSNYERKYEKIGLWLGVCGMPNVGKSTIINQIRMISDLENKRSTAKATATVATTKGLRGYKILQNPLIYLMDSPGVMIPSNIVPEYGLKMALVGLIKETQIDKLLLVEFMMEWYESLEQENAKKLYYHNLRLQKPINAMDYIEKVRDRYKLYNVDAALDKIINCFREGTLGKVTLDEPVDVNK